MCRLLIIVVVFALSIAGGMASGCGFPSERSRSWVYPYFDELRIRQDAHPFFVNDGPYGREEIAGWLRLFRAPDLSTEWRARWLLGMLGEEYAPEITLDEADGLAWVQNLMMGMRSERGGRLESEALVGLTVYSSTGLSMSTSLRATINGETRHKVKPRLWQNRGRATLDYGGIGFKRGGFSLLVGRDELSWGASRERGLLLSGSGPSLDMAKLSLETERIRFTSFHSQLRRGENEEWDPRIRRFLAAHRIEFLVGRRYSLSLSEAVLYGGEGRTFEPRYLNPFLIFYAEQWNSKQNDNIFIAGDFSVLFPNKAEIRGELLIDDFQYDFETEPHEYGFGLSVLAKNPFLASRSLMRASYYQVRHNVYGHLIDWNRYIHEDESIGYPDGSDGDRFEVWSAVTVPEPVTWRIGYAFERKGEGRATDPQEPKGPNVRFPSGVVERSHNLNLDICWRPSYEWLVRVGCEWSDTENKDNVADRSVDGFGFFLDITFNFKWASR